MALALADLDLVLHRDEDLEDPILHAHRLDAMLEVGLDLVLVAGVRVDHVPAPSRLPDDVGRGGRAHAMFARKPITPWKIASQNATKAPDEADGEHQDRQVARLREGRPGDLPELGDRLGNEAANSLHVIVTQPFGDVAGAIGLEPTTAGLETGALPIEPPLRFDRRYLASRWRCDVAHGDSTS